MKQTRPATLGRNKTTKIGTRKNSHPLGVLTGSFAMDDSDMMMADMMRRMSNDYSK